jgi:hypothetical protein
MQRAVILGFQFSSVLVLHFLYWAIFVCVSVLKRSPDTAMLVQFLALPNGSCLEDRFSVLLARFYDEKSAFARE